MSCNYYNNKPKQSMKVKVTLISKKYSGSLYRCDGNLNTMLYAPSPNVHLRTDWRRKQSETCDY